MLLNIVTINQLFAIKNVIITNIFKTELKFSFPHNMTEMKGSTLKLHYIYSASF